MGTKFDVNNSSLSFSEGSGIKPFVLLEATTFLQDREVTVNITGPADKLRTEISSNPPVPNNDTLSLFSPEMNIHDPYKFLQSTTSNLAQTTVTSAVFNPLEEQITSGLGLDIFTIKFSPTGTIGLDIGKNINSWLSMSYHIYNKDEMDNLNQSNYIFEREVFDIRFKLNKYATFNIGTNTTGNITTKLQVDYRF